MSSKLRAQPRPGLRGLRASTCCERAFPKFSRRLLLTSLSERLRGSGGSARHIYF